MSLPDRAKKISFLDSSTLLGHLKPDKGARTQEIAANRDLQKAIIAIMALPDDAGVTFFYWLSKECNAGVKINTGNSNVYAMAELRDLWTIIENYLIACNPSFAVRLQEMRQGDILKRITL